MHLNGETDKMSFKGTICRKWAVVLNINDSEKKMDSRVSSAPTPGQYTVHVYFHNIQTSSPLKPPGQSKVTLI